MHFLAGLTWMVDLIRPVDSELRMDFIKTRVMMKFAFVHKTYEPY